MFTKLLGQGDISKLKAELSKKTVAVKTHLKDVQEAGIELGACRRCDSHGFSDGFCRTTRRRD